MTRKVLCGSVRQNLRNCLLSIPVASSVGRSPHPELAPAVILDWEAPVPAVHWRSGKRVFDDDDRPDDRHGGTIINLVDLDAIAGIPEGVGELEPFTF